MKPYQPYVTDKQRKVLWAVLLGALNYRSNGSYLGDERVGEVIVQLLGREMIKIHDNTYEITDRGRLYL